MVTDTESEFFPGKKLWLYKGDRVTAQKTCGCLLLLRLGLLIEDVQRRREDLLLKGSAPYRVAGGRGQREDPFGPPRPGRPGVGRRR